MLNDPTILRRVADYFGLPELQIPPAMLESPHANLTATGAVMAQPRW